MLAAVRLCAAGSAAGHSGGVTTPACRWPARRRPLCRPPVLIVTWVGVGYSSSY